MNHSPTTVTSIATINKYMKIKISFAADWQTENLEDTIINIIIIIT